MPWLLGSLFLFHFRIFKSQMYAIPFLIFFFSSNSPTVSYYTFLFPIAVVSLIPSLQVMLLDLKMRGILEAIKMVTSSNCTKINDAIILGWKLKLVRASEWYFLLHLVILLVTLNIYMPQLNCHTECSPISHIMSISLFFFFCFFFFTPFNFPHIKWTKKNLLLLKVRLAHACLFCLGTST